jgi:hypothetical protein
LQWSAAEVAILQRYHAKSPIGAERQDTMLAQIAQLIYNSNAKKGSQKKLRDFLLFRPRHKASNALDQAIIDELGG